MELQALLGLCGLGVAGAAVLLLMGLFSASGTSYEEAIAQQRKAATELLALAENKNKPKKNLKKANKKLAKKEKKETVAVATGSEPESEAQAESGVDEDTTPSPKHHVDFSPPVIVDVQRDAPPNIKIRKRGKDPKVKPILLNKEDPSCVSDPSTPPSPTGSHVSNHFEEIHPKDDFELLHSTLAAEKVSEKKEESDKKEPKAGKPAKVKAAKQPVIEPAKEEIQRNLSATSEAPKEQRKAVKKSEKKSEETPEVVREETVPPLNAPQPSELTTEKLLRNALAAAPSSAPPSAAHTPPHKPKKNKKPENLLALMAGDTGGVNFSELVRVVREAALSRTEIQILTDTLLNKQHDQLPQHSEWTEGPNDPMQKLKKQLADKEKALADEVEASQAIHAKLKELRASLNAERARATAATRSAEEAAAEQLALQARLQRLVDENHALAQEKMLLQSKLNAEGEAQAQRVQMEMHLQRLSDSESALVGQLSALQAEASALALEAGQARCDVAAARDAMLLAQQHAAELQQQLQEANRVCAELDAQRQNAIHAEQTAQQELRQMQERLSGLTDLQNEIQRLKTSLQQTEIESEKLKEENEKQKQQLSNELSSLREQLAAREVELAEMRQMKVAAPAQNGLPPSGNEHKAAELAKVEGVIESLKAELATAQKSNSEQKEQVARLHEQLKQYQDKNNELRTKNWKVMEALQLAEKSLQAKAPAMPAQDSIREALSKAEEAQFKEVQSILSSACPRLAPSKASGRSWIETFADALKKELEKASSAPKVDESRVANLTAQNDHLQGLVDKYKRIIDDTEGVLSRLQQNVTREEARWAQQLADKQRELDELRHRTLTQMQNKIDSLQAELRQAQESKHNNHTFADAERLTEERLMAGLSEKHKLDSFNGPLQVGLEEK